jgi:hypothetical protein
MCVYAPAPPADMADEDIVASSCTYPGNTLLLYIPQFAHFLTEVENWWNKRKNNCIVKCLKRHLTRRNQFRLLHNKLANHHGRVLEVIWSKNPINH